MNKIIFFSLIIFLIATRAFASVRINEIMYDAEGSDAEREWIEVYNDGSEAVDLSKWKLFEANTNHGLTPYQGGSALLSGGFALIADNPTKFLADWPSFSGAIFDSTFSLSNAGESLALKDENLNIAEEASYSSSSGATGDGKSLQLTLNKFQAANPTPGMINGSAVSTSNNEPIIENSLTNTANTQATSDPNSYKLEIIAPEKVLAEMSFVVGLKAEYGAQPVISGKFYWNFGNGETKESAKNEPFNYTYGIAGDYLIVLDYFKNADQNPVSSAQFKVKVLSMPAAISVVEAQKENAPPVVEQKPILPIKPVVVEKVEGVSDIKVKASDMEANVLSSVKEEDMNLNSNKSSLMPWLLALSGFILISLFSIFLFKKSPKPQTQSISEEAEGFEIN